MPGCVLGGYATGRATCKRGRNTVPIMRSESASSKCHKTGAHPIDTEVVCEQATNSEKTRKAAKAAKGK